MDLDFTLKIAGTDVTKDVIEWELKDIESDTSHITAVLASPENRYAGAFSTDSDELSLTWGGGSGGMLGPVEFAVRIIDEKWAGSGSVVSVTAYDWTERFDSKTFSGNFGEDVDYKEAADKIAKSFDTYFEKNDLKSGKGNKDESISLFNMEGDKALNDFAKKGIDPGGNPFEAVQKHWDNKPPENGPNATTGTILNGGQNKQPLINDEELRKIRESVVAGFAEQNADAAGSTSITAHLVVVDYPSMKAKQGVTVLGAGPKGSGHWYVESVTHKWTSGEGYSAACDLMRSNAGKQGQSPQGVGQASSGVAGSASGAANTASSVTGGGTQESGQTEPPKKDGAPNVWYAEIYKKNAMYIGPRKLDAPAQMTFTIGDGKHVVAFNWSINVQVPKLGGDKMQYKNLATNMPNKVKKVNQEFFDAGGTV